jgi:hypothetical protein
VPQIFMSVPAEISEETRVTGELQKLGFDYVAGAEVACREYAGPKAPNALTDGRRAMQKWPNVANGLAQEIDGGRRW